jgi:hypothetical protein
MYIHEGGIPGYLVQTSLASWGFGCSRFCEEKKDKARPDLGEMDTVYCDTSSLRCDSLFNSIAGTTLGRRVKFLKSRSIPLQHTENTTHSTLHCRLVSISAIHAANKL